jgi:hypothetical protein
MDEITLIISFAAANAIAITIVVAATIRMAKNLKVDAHLEKKSVKE